MYTTTTHRNQLSQVTEYTSQRNTHLHFVPNAQIPNTTLHS